MENSMEIIPSVGYVGTLCEVYKFAIFYLIQNAKIY